MEDKKATPVSLEPTYPEEMTFEERVAKIFAFEKEHRGIDWIALFDEGHSGQFKAAKLVHQHLQDFIAKHEIPDEEIPEETKAILRPLASMASQAPERDLASNGNLLGGTPDVMPIWPLDQAALARWQAASGGSIKDLIATQISAMQSIQTVHNEPGPIAEISLGIGIVAWTQRAYAVFAAARALAGVTDAYAVLMGVMEVGGATITLAITTGILAVLIPILLIMMKDATCYMVVINNSRDNLDVVDVHLTHGNQNVQFVNYDQKKSIPASATIKDPSGKVVSTTFWAGIFVAQKKELALFGSQGAFNFAPTPLFPKGIFVGWEIPLTKFGGSNCGLVALDYDGSTSGFSDLTNDHGSSENTSSGANQTSVRQRMNSGGGSQGYMSVIVTGPTSP